MCGSCDHLLLRTIFIPGDSSRSAFDGLLHAVIRHATAQDARHTLANLRVIRSRITIQQRLRGHDLTVLAEAALRNLFVDPGLLHGMKPSIFGKPFERCDLASEG